MQSDVDAMLFIKSAKRGKIKEEEEAMAPRRIVEVFFLLAVASTRAKDCVRHSDCVDHTRLQDKVAAACTLDLCTSRGECASVSTSIPIFTVDGIVCPPRRVLRDEDDRNLCLDRETHDPLPVGTKCGYNSLCGLETTCDGKGTCRDDAECVRTKSDVKIVIVFLILGLLALIALIVVMIFVARIFAR